MTGRAGLLNVFGFNHPTRDSTPRQAQNAGDLGFVVQCNAER